MLQNEKSIVMKRRMKSEEVSAYLFLVKKLRELNTWKKRGHGIKFLTRQCSILILIQSHVSHNEPFLEPMLVWNFNRSVSQFIQSKRWIN